MHIQLVGSILLIVVCATINRGVKRVTHDHKSVGRYISILYRRAQAYIASQMKPYEIGSGQSIFLMALLQNDGINQEELCRKLMIDKGTTARAIGKLEKAGYVMRSINPEDRRAYHIFITDKGRRIQPILYKALVSWTDILVADLNEEEREMLYVIFEKMVKSAALHIGEEI